MTPEEEVQRDADIAAWLVAIVVFLIGLAMGRLTT